MGRTLIQFAGTTTTKANSETLPKNVIIVDEETKQLVLHDGVTQGGFRIGDRGGESPATTDLDNLTSTGKNIGNWSTNVTNCVIEIPQNIKLELNNNTLTLKAGSKIYVPNGAGVFNEVTTSADTSMSNGEAAGDKFVFMRTSTMGLMGIMKTNCVSSDTAPAAGTYQIWFDRINNKIYEDVNRTGDWDDSTGLCLPIGIYTSTNPTITSINQVFNGFGYIGYTFFALPGVKAIHSNGFNTNGSYKNDLLVLDHVCLNTTDNVGVSSGLAGQLTLRSDGSYTQFSDSKYQWKYDELKNYFYYTVNGDRNWIDVGTYYKNPSTGVIEFFAPKQVLHVSEYPDIPKIQIRPSLPANPDPDTYYFIPE